MNSLFASNFARLCAVTRSGLASAPQVRYKHLPGHRHLRCLITNRRFAKHLKREKRQEENKLEEFFLPPTEKIEFGLQSLETRGFLRNTKPYTPPENVSERILNIAKLSTGIKDQNDLLKFELTDPDTRFNFLRQCVTELRHDIPNSQLHKMTTVSAVIDYYKLPVSIVNSYNKMCDNPESLPPNLHLQKEPLRFNPETDTMFGGISAYPERSNIIVGLRARKKFKGFDARPATSKLY